jgi:hypothetical protein
MATIISRLLAVFVLLMFWGCPEGHESVPGPEAKDLLKRLDGYIVRSEYRSGIKAICLPELKETIVLPGQPSPSVHALSGPDRDGRIAYIEDHEKKHLLKAVRIDGTKDTAIFSRPGNALWATHGEIGEGLALAPRGGLVAFHSGLSHKQMSWRLFSQGSIEIWDIAKKAARPIHVDAIDSQMAWFPDSKRLAYIALVPRSNLVPNGVNISELMHGEYMHDWDVLPAVHILDVESGNTRFLTLGEHPIVSFDGKTVLVSNYVGEVSECGETKYANQMPETTTIWHLIDVQTGKATKATWPGAANGAVALPADDLVLYYGWPTSGQPIKHSPYGSFKAGIQLVTIKVAVLNSKKFQTVLSDIDPRGSTTLSYGRVAKK